MDDKQTTHTNDEYIKPTVVDYGELKDLTELVGGIFSDVPFGTVGNVGLSRP